MCTLGISIQLNYAPIIFLIGDINNILHKIALPALPEFTTVKSLCDHLSKYFVDKIKTIRSKFQDRVQIFHQCKKQKSDKKNNVFERVTEDEVKNYFNIVKILWSEPHFYERAKKLSRQISNSHHWHNKYFNGNQYISSKCHRSACKTPT